MLSNTPKKKTLASGTPQYLWWHIEIMNKLIVGYAIVHNIVIVKTSIILIVFGGYVVLESTRIDTGNLHPSIFVP